VDNGSRSAVFVTGARWGRRRQRRRFERPDGGPTGPSDRGPSGERDRVAAGRRPPRRRLRVGRRCHASRWGAPPFCEL